jgi:hypothetical protein
LAIYLKKKKMKTMKILSVLALIFSFSQCGSTKFESNPPFKITKVEYYNWVGGVPGVRGTNVQINFKNKTTIVFDSLYFKKRATKIKTSTPLYIIANYNTSRKLASDIIVHLDIKKEVKNKVPTINKIPFNLKENEAVLSYHENGEKKYIKIKNITKKDTSSFTKIQ